MKLEALGQCSGESKYSNDYPHTEHDVWCAWVLATEVNATIAKIDASEALVSSSSPFIIPTILVVQLSTHPLNLTCFQKLPGVLGLFTKADVPGENLILTTEVLMVVQNEDFFVQDRVIYYGQPCGVIAATNFALAQKAAALVKITYDRPAVAKPLLSNIRSVLESGDKSRIQTVPNDAVVKEPKLKSKHEIQGAFQIEGQYHYTMEPQTTVVVPQDGKYEVYASTQWIGGIHYAITNVLKIPASKISISSGHLGGAYGAKITGAVRVAAACALVAYHLQRPTRFAMQLEQTMLSLGKRCPMTGNYNVGVDDNGKIESMTVEIFSDAGCTHNDFVAPLIQSSIANIYPSEHWTIKANAVITDAASNLWMRGPGDLEGIAMSENTIEHIAWTIKKDPSEVRLANINSDHMYHQIYKEFLKTVEYAKRREEVDAFNERNRWKKRGLATMAMKYGFFYFGTYSAYLSIFHEDGSVAITHGGIEMGQGLNTKMCQVVAHLLKIPLELVQVKPSTEHVSPNSVGTGGSQTSEAIAWVSIQVQASL